MKTAMLRVAIGVVTFALVASAAGELEQASKLYNRTDYEGSLRVLNAIPEKNAAVHALTGKNYYMLGEFKKASDAYEKAVAASPGSSEYHNWLGKAYGKRAETSSPFTAPGLASKARQQFEKAYELNPKNKDAADDLFEYYLEAPGFLGGGMDKAGKLAERVAATDPAQGLWLQARIAERRKDFNKAEEHLRRAVREAPAQVGRVVDLAKFLARHGKIDESERTFRAAEKLDPDNRRLLYDRAETYIQTGRNLDEARTLLKQYLASPIGPEDPSRADAQKLLRQAGG
jgi:tetratricopeptide (TPR) repeat protein